MSKLIGQNLGRYTILEPQGEGGMGTVYKAFDTHLECDVAVKVIRTAQLSEDEAVTMVKRFKQEARLLSQLTHPNIIKITDYGEFEGSPYLVMVYLPGGSLKERMTGEPIPHAKAARLLAPVARALEYAHLQGMLHRDVKPSNIMMTQSGEPILTDFGVAKLFDSEKTSALTGTGVGIGTPEYMAPEQAVSGSIDARADIYALGVVFFELVTGRKPYIADTPLAVLIKQASEALPLPSDLVKGLPDAAERVLLKALAKKPEDRYADMGAFAAALEGLAGGAASPPRTPEALRAQAVPAGRQDMNRTTVQPIQQAAPKAATATGGHGKRKLKWYAWLLIGIGSLAALCGITILLVFLLGGGAQYYLPPWEATIPVEPTRIGPTSYPTTSIDSLMALDMTAVPLYGNAIMPAGFQEKRVQDVIAMGDIDVAQVLPDCNGDPGGYVNEAPTYRINWSGSSEHLLAFHFVADDPSRSAVIVVFTPDGMWFCDYDPGTVQNPGVLFDYAPDGDYSVWVGTAVYGENFPGTLVISENHDLP